ncbi:hypothetical protein DIPPA_16173 [Diplonema papillatum]|nr:hypothetical protein DIPPA_16173 [Diplonema papillatum]
MAAPPLTDAPPTTAPTAAPTSEPSMAPDTLVPDNSTFAPTPMEIDDVPDYAPLAVGVVLTFCVLLLCGYVMYRLFTGPRRGSKDRADYSTTDHREITTFNSFRGNDLASVVLSGNGNPPSGVERPALVVVVESDRANGNAAESAVNVARSMGASSIRLLSEKSAEKPTRASILAGLRWLTSSLKKEVEVLIVVCAEACDGGFKPCDYDFAGPVLASDITDEVSVLTDARIAIVYDVPSTRAVWSLPFSLAPGACAPPYQPSKQDKPRHPLVLMAPCSNGRPGELVEALHRLSDRDYGYVSPVLEFVHNGMRSTAGAQAYPVCWSNRPFTQHSRFPFATNPRESQYYPPSMEPGYDGRSGSRPPSPGKVRYHADGHDEPYPIWSKNLSHDQPPQRYDSASSEGEAFLSWASANPRGGRPNLNSHIHPPSRRHRGSNGGIADKEWPSPRSRSPVSVAALHSPTWASPPGGSAVFPAPAGFPAPPRLTSPQASFRTSMRTTSPRGRSPTRSASPAAGHLSDVLYPSPGRGGGAGAAAPERCNCMLQSHTSIPHYSYKRATVRAKLGRDWILEVSIEGEADPLEIPLEDIERCGAEENGGTDYPDQAMFVVPYNEPRIVVVFDSTETRDIWIGWVHTHRPQSVVILPSTFSLPPLY